jgi:hypothetical protein
MMLGLLLNACGGGGATTTPPQPPNQDDQGQGGDPSDITPPGITPAQFTVPGGFTDLRGVAASMTYVYVGDATTLYCFDKNGNFLNAVAAPATIQAVGVFPTTPDVEGVDMADYEFAGFPVILHNPVSNVGFIRIYGPNLDTLTTREDVGNPDAPKFIALPDTAQVNPNWPRDVPDLPVVIRVYDMTVDRFGSIECVVDLDYAGPPTPDYNRGVEIFNQFRSYTIEEPTTTLIDDPDNPGQQISVGVPIFAQEMGYSCGDMGTIGIDSFFPYNRTNLIYTWYTGDYNLLRDYVGIGSITLNPNSETYNLSSFANNPFGYLRVLGESVGSAPGSFNQNPPYAPDGTLEDADLSNGGPSGMFCDPMTDNVYICDPGNRRIQVFAPETGAFLRQIGDGTRGRAGGSFLAPSSVWVDFEGNIFVTDVNDLRVLREKQPGLHFGSVGGTVSRLDTMQPLEGATVSIGSEVANLGAVATNINGQYRIRYLPTGTYYMSATKFGYDSDTATVQIINDQMITANFNLNPRTPATTGSYTGNVVDSFTNLPLPGVSVSIVGTSVTATTDSLGRFMINNLAPGQHQVIFSLAGYVTVTRDVEIIGGTTVTDQLIQMDPAGT